MGYEVFSLVCAWLLSREPGATRCGQERGHIKLPFQEAVEILRLVLSASLHRPHLVFESLVSNKMVGAAGERGVFALTGGTGQPYSSGLRQLG